MRQSDRGNLSLKHFLFVLSISLLVLPGYVLAISLGKISSISETNKPFSANIELENTKISQLDKISVSLATPAQFSRAGLNYSPLVSSLRFNTDISADGKPIVHVSSSMAITEPFLGFLVELNSPNGKEIKKYLVAIGQSESGGQTRDSAPGRLVNTSPAEPTAIKTPNSKTKSVEDKDFPLLYGPIRSGETLLDVADSLSIKGFSPEQIAMALFRSNPQAFMEGDANKPKPGSVLVIPDRMALSASSTGVAKMQLRHLMRGDPVVLSSPSLAVQTREDRRDQSQAVPSEMMSEALLHTSMAPPVKATEDGEAVMASERNNVSSPIRYGPISPGTSLETIARRLAPPEATVAQTAIALFVNNPSAFIGGDIGKLKVGARLELPDAKAVFAYPADMAQQEYQTAKRGGGINIEKIQLALASAAQERDATPGKVAPLSPEAPTAVADERADDGGRPQDNPSSPGNSNGFGLLMEASAKTEVQAVPVIPANTLAENKSGASREALIAASTDTTNDLAPPNAPASLEATKVPQDTEQPKQVQVPGPGTARVDEQAAETIVLRGRIAELERWLTDLRGTMGSIDLQLNQLLKATGNSQMGTEWISSVKSPSEALEETGSDKLNQGRGQFSSLVPLTIGTEGTEGNFIKLALSLQISVFWLLVITVMIVLIIMLGILYISRDRRRRLNGVAGGVPITKSSSRGNPPAGQIDARAAAEGVTGDIDSIKSSLKNPFEIRKSDEPDTINGSSPSLKQNLSAAGTSGHKEAPISRENNLDDFDHFWDEEGVYAPHEAEQVANFMEDDLPMDDSLKNITLIDKVMKDDLMNNDQMNNELIKDEVASDDLRKDEAAQAGSMEDEVSYYEIEDKIDMAMALLQTNQQDSAKVFLHEIIRKGMPNQQDLARDLLKRADLT